MAITLDKLKSTMYCDVADTSGFDDVITELWSDVVDRAIGYLDDSTNYATEADLTADVEQALCKQIAKEFLRRGQLGLNSVTYPDGSISKYDEAEWMPQVKTVLERYKRYSFGEES